MLQRIGDTFKAHKWLPYLFFGGITLLLVPWGVSGIANISFGSSTDAARVNGESIPYEQVRQAWLQQQAEWQQRLGGDMPAAVKTRLIDQLLEGYVRTALVTQRTHKLGYRVSDEQVRQAVRSEPAFQLDGKYSADVARARLSQAGISVDAFEADVRDALQRAQIEHGIEVSDFITSSELGRLGALQNEERQIRYALLPTAKFAGNVAVDDAAVKAYYEQHVGEFMTPEFVHLQYADLRLDQVAAQLQVTDADLHEYYEKNKNRYVVPEQRHGAHILIAVNKDRDAAAALKRAQEVLAKLKAGGDFAALAKQYSDDAGSAAQGGDLGWSQRSSFVGPFADALFSMRVNEVRGPVKTEFGYHIIRLEGIQAGKTKSFDEARAEIDAQLRHDRAADRFGDVQEQIQQRLDQPGTSLEALAKEFNMQVGDVPQFIKGSGAPGLGDSHDLEDVVFSDAVLGEHHIGGPVLLGEDRMVLVRALDHHKPAPKPIAEVRDTIVAAVRKERGSQAAIQAAQAAARRLDAGTPFDTVAQDLGVKAEPTRYVGRTDPAVPAPIRDAVFASQKPTKQKPVFRALPLTDGAALVAITDVRTNSEPNPAQQAEARNREAEALGEAAANAYLEQLRLSAKVQKNPQVFEQ